MESAFVLFRSGKRVTMRETDMSVSKMSTLFQVDASSIYITDDSNTAIFPEPSGKFDVYGLAHRGHYEVHGDAVNQGGGAQPSSSFSFMREEMTGDKRIDQLKQQRRASQKLQRPHCTVQSGKRKAASVEATASAKEALICLVCKGLLSCPMGSTCCNSLVGCKGCVSSGY
ncbi:hypothetical protein WMY93_026137 [Mugilogobius chulae]|uniref:Uncharacterized protein n=1 Tax=Mugilogobius chulae TaxID=88201 RepID=A0AAW0MWR9_9GOBI